MAAPPPPNPVTTPNVCDDGEVPTLPPPPSPPPPPPPFAFEDDPDHEVFLWGQALPQYVHWRIASLVNDPPRSWEDNGGRVFGVVSAQFPVAGEKSECCPDDDSDDSLTDMDVDEEILESTSMEGLSFNALSTDSS